jgi:hypothetical protein
MAPPRTSNKNSSLVVSQIRASSQFGSQGQTSVFIRAKNGMCRWRPHAISEAATVQRTPASTFGASIVCQMPVNTFTKLRITRAYIKLLCIPEGEARIVSLIQIGNYEIRMLDVSKADVADGPLFVIELFDRDSQSSVDSCVCDDVEKGAAAFEEFISR